MAAVPKMERRMSSGLSCAVALGMKGMFARTVYVVLASISRGRMLSASQAVKKWKFPDLWVRNVSSSGICNMFCSC